MYTRSPATPLPQTLTLAVKTGDYDFVELAQKKGAKPDAQTLTWACVSRNFHIIDTVLLMGAMPDNETLAAACATNDVAVVQKVLGKGAIVSERAIKVAQQNGNQEILRLLTPEQTSTPVAYIPYSTHNTQMIQQQAVQNFDQPMKPQQNYSQQWTQQNYNSQATLFPQQPELESTQQMFVELARKQNEEARKKKEEEDAIRRKAAEEARKRREAEEMEERRREASEEAIRRKVEGDIRRQADKEKAELAHTLKNEKEENHRLQQQLADKKQALQHAQSASHHDSAFTDSAKRAAGATAGSFLARAALSQAFGGASPF